MTPERYFLVLSPDVFGYLSNFFTLATKVAVSETGKRYRFFFQKELQDKRAEYFKLTDYAHALGYKNTCQLFENINKIRDKKTKEIAISIVKNDETQFQSFIKSNKDNIELLSKPDVFIKSLIFLIAVTQQKNLQNILWVEYCALYKINDSTLPLLSQQSIINLTYLALYCHNNEKLNILLTHLAQIKNDLYAIFIQFVDLAIELRDIEAIQSIHQIYKSKTDNSIIEKSYYENACKNNDIDLITVFTSTTNTFSHLYLHQSPVTLQGSTVNHSNALLKKTFSITEGNHKLYFLYNVAKKYLSPIIEETTLNSHQGIVGHKK